MANHQQSFRQNDRIQRQSGDSESGALAEKAKDAASALGRRASEVSSALGSGMESLAGAIRDRGPHGGMWGSASDQVAHTLESGGRHLKQEGFGGLVDDVAAVVRRNPIQAVLIGIGLGFLLARTTSRS